MKPKNSRRPTPIKPKQGQESVWDYPRPPRVESSKQRIVLTFAGVVIIDTTDAFRVLETSHPPVYYLPMEEFMSGVLVPVAGTTFCEFKGEASYFDVKLGGVTAARAAWSYLTPAVGYEQLAGRIALYPSKMDSCRVDGEVVVPQEGDFYGSWITSNIVGPFKGGPGTWGW